MRVELNVVRWVARVAPWLAPLPNAFLVARATMGYLALPLAVAVIAGLVIELLGIATVHTALDLYRWNLQPRVRKEKGGWERAPFGLALATTGVYFLAVVFLSVVLEALPVLAVWAPALFPLVAATGAVTLGIISQQEERAARYFGSRERTRRRTRRRIKDAQDAPSTAPSTAPRTRPGGRFGDAQGGKGNGRGEGAQIGDLGAVNASRAARKQHLLEQMVALYEADPAAGPSAIGRVLGVHRNTVYNYLGELERQRRVVRNDGRVEVIQP